MKPLLPLQCLAAVLAAGLATGSGAVALGQAEGTSLLGRALEVSVALHADAAGAIPGCAAADVFYGDHRVPASQVATELQPRSPGAQLRLRAAAPVSARLVIVYLHFGCTERVTRKLVLVAQAEAQQGGSDQAAPLPGAADAAAAPASSVRRGVAWPPAMPAAAGAVRTASPPQPPAQPRLVLQAALASPIDPPRLQLTAMLSSSAPEPAPPERAAAAALWRVLGSPAEHLLEDGRRAQALQQEVAGLRVSLQRQGQDVAQLRARTGQAETRRYANSVVYGLVLWAVAMGLLAALALSRSHRVRPGWWPEHRATEPAETTGFERSLPATSRRKLPPARSRDTGQPPDGQRPGSRSLQAQELHEVQEQAGLLLSAGRHEQAIELLRGHVGANPAAGAVAWLDLLDIYHRLGRRDEFDHTRGEFERHFNAHVPAFEDYRQGKGPGLEGYRKVVAHITSTWPSRRAQELLEECIFRRPGHSGRPAFSLEAYRDLVFLHRLGAGLLARSARA